MARLANTQWEKDQSARIKKLENDLLQQKRRIATLERRADRDDKEMMKLRKQIEHLKKK